MMNIIEALNIGSLYQNIAFYSIITLLAVVNLDILKYHSKQRGYKSAISNH